jgi:hypothetical protein
MGERLNGIQEVGSSILPGSTNLPNDTKTISRPSGRLWFMGEVVKTYKGGGRRVEKLRGDTGHIGVVKKLRSSEPHPAD